MKASAANLNTSQVGVTVTSTWQPGTDLRVCATYPFSINLIGLVVQKRQPQLVHNGACGMTRDRYQTKCERGQMLAIWPSRSWRSAPWARSSWTSARGSGLTGRRRRSPTPPRSQARRSFPRRLRKRRRSRRSTARRTAEASRRSSSPRTRSRTTRSRLRPSASHPASSRGARDLLRQRQGQRRGASLEPRLGEVCRAVRSRQVAPDALRREAAPASTSPTRSTC